MPSLIRCMSARLFTPTRAIHCPRAFEPPAPRYASHRRHAIGAAVTPLTPVQRRAPLRAANSRYAASATVLPDAGDELTCRTSGYATPLLPVRPHEYASRDADATLCLALADAISPKTQYYAARLIRRLVSGWSGHAATSPPAPPRRLRAGHAAA